VPRHGTHARPGENTCTGRGWDGQRHEGCPDRAVCTAWRDRFGASRDGFLEGVVSTVWRGRHDGVNAVLAAGAVAFQATEY
jgi:hypothetical protein